MRSVILKGKARMDQAYLCMLLSAFAHILSLALLTASLSARSFHYYEDVSKMKDKLCSDIQSHQVHHHKLQISYDAISTSPTHPV